MVELHSSPHMDEPNDPTVPPVFRSRREMREAEARAAARKPAFSRAAVPAVPVAPASVASVPPVVVPRAVAPAPSKKLRKRPIATVAVMTVIGGMFAVAALPAYAFTPSAEETATVAAEVSSQTLDISASRGATASFAVRDGFGATTPEELAERTRDAERAAANATYASSGARALGDDYPWPYEATAYEGGGLSPLGYYYRECVDFVAWRLNRDAGSTNAPYQYVWGNLTPSGGSGAQWGRAWENKGWTVSQTPIVGSVAYFPGENHVAYVKEVLEGGFVVIEEYNYIPHSYGQRTIASTDATSYLYPPGQ